MGGAAISPDLDLVAYVAEKKEPKKEHFCKTKNREKEGEEKKGKEEKARPGAEYKLKEDFGEQMIGKSEPCVVLLHLKEDRYTSGTVVNALFNNPPLPSGSRCWTARPCSGLPTTTRASCASAARTSWWASPSSPGHTTSVWSTAATGQVKKEKIQFYFQVNR